MSIYASLAPKQANGFGYGTTAAEVVRSLDLKGKHILLTGCNSGLGFETMRALAAKGATVIGAARTIEKAQKAADRVAGTVIPVACELSSVESVRACVNTVKDLGVTLDAIICNAGIMALPKLQQKHDIELQFFTNHISHFILVTELLETLSKEDGRVVMVSSNAHTRAPDAGIEFDNLSGKRNYSPWGAYGQSKLANLLFARELNERMEEGRSAYALHPGVIKTNIGRHLNPVMDLVWALGSVVALKSEEQGAATQCYAAVHPNALQHAGLYLSHCNLASSNEHGRDLKMARKLWEVSEELVASLS